MKTDEPPIPAIRSRMAREMMMHGNDLMLAGVIAKKRGDVARGHALVRLAKRQQDLAEDFDLLVTHQNGDRQS